MKLADAIARYKADRLAKGYAVDTVRGEQGVLRELLRAVGNIQLSSLEPNHIDALWYRKRDEWSPGTSNKARAMLASFFKWAQSRGLMPKGNDPMEGLRKRKVPERDRVIIPPAEWPEVLDAAGNPRDRAIVAIGLYLFLRVSETSRLKWSDVDFDMPRRGTPQWTPTVSVYRKKTQTTDVLPLSVELFEELRRWKLAYAAEVGQAVRPNWYVVPGRTPTYFTGEKDGDLLKQAMAQLVPTRPIKDVTRVIGKVLKDADRWGMGEGGHTLRRSGAVAWYNALSEVGHDRAIRMVQAMLGHSGIQTTEVYLRLSLDRKTRNDLLAGKRMFPQLSGDAVVTPLKEAPDGEENAGAL